MRRHVSVVILCFALACGQREVQSARPPTEPLEGRANARLSERALRDSSVVDLFDRLRLRPILKSRRRDPRSLVYTGSLVGDPSSEVILAQVGNAFEGTVVRGTCPQTCSSFEPVDGNIDLVPFDIHKFVTDGIPLTAPAGFSGFRGDSFFKDDSEGSEDELLRAPSPCVSEVTAPITAVVLYTDDAKTTAGSEDAITALIYYAEAATNEIFKTSGLPTRLNVLDIQSLSFTETGYLEDDLKTFRKKGAAARESAGADVAFLVVSRGDDVGRSYLLNPNPTMLHDLAFGVVRVDGLKCGWSLTHELGHLLGACHDRNQKEKLTPCPFDSADSHYGHRNNISGRRWETIMSRASEKFVRQPRWSNPLQKCGVDDLGSAANDNVSWLMTSAPEVAQFRCTATTP